MIKVQAEDFDVGRELENLSSGNLGVGGVSCFIGLVRDMAGDESIQAMTLEHYPEMTEKSLKSIVTEARERWDLQNVTIIHRIGELKVNDQIVLVVTTSKHRQAAFESCYFIMDYLKTDAPFWKKESTEQKEEWVESRKSDNEQKKRWQP